MMFSTDTVVTETWYRVSYVDARNDPYVVERPANEAASMIAAVCAWQDCHIVNVEAVEGP